LYLAGKALNALFADRMQVDLAPLDQLGAILQAGTRRFGPTFESAINAELALTGNQRLHRVDVLRVGPSRDIGQIVAEYAASPELARRERGVVATVMRCLAMAGSTRSGNLLSYLLFDGAFAAELVSLGRADARRQHEELCTFLAPQETSPPQALLSRAG